jgi:hypothetical protein
MDTRVNTGQPMACAASNIFWFSPENVLRSEIGVPILELEKTDTVLMSILKAHI